MVDAYLAKLFGIAKATKEGLLHEVNKLRQLDPRLGYSVPLLSEHSMKIVQLPESAIYSKFPFTVKASRLRASGS